MVDGVNDPNRYSTRRPLLGAGLPAVLMGMAALAVAGSFDGFVKGLFLGGGVALVLIGAYLLGSVAWPRGGDGEWLPSRDGAPRDRGTGSGR